MQFLLQLFPHLVRQLGLGDLPAVVVEFLVSSLLVLTQLLLDDLELLPQDVVTLVAGQLIPHLVLHLLLHLQDLYLPAEALAQLLQAAHRPQLLQDHLLVPGPHGQILGNVVGDISRILAGEHREQNIRRHFGRQFNVILKQLVGLADQRLCTGRTLYRLLHRDPFYLSHQIGRGFHYLAQPATADTLHHDPDIVSGQAEDLAHVADGADGIEVSLLGIFYGQIPLGHQENGLPAGHGLVQGLDGALPPHIEVEQHIGEDRQSTQGKRRHGDSRICLHMGTSLIQRQKPGTGSCGLLSKTRCSEFLTSVLRVQALII